LSPFAAISGKRKGPVFLIGLPGSGKTTVAPLLADLLGIASRDLDEEYSRRFGQSPANAIREHGETTFRIREAELLAMAAATTEVVACGGGTAAQPHSMDRMLQSGTVILLETPLDALAGRLGSAEEHPLLEGKPLPEALAGLERSRDRYFERAHVKISTAGLTPWRVAHSIWRELLEFSPGWGEAAPGAEAFKEVPGGWQAHLELGPRSCPVRLDKGRRWQGLVRFLQVTLGRRRVVALLDSGLPEKWRKSLIETLGKDVPICHMPAGETSKELARLPDFVRSLLGAGVDRSMAVLAVGGGAVLDAAGFLASTYMRGVPLVAVPTTFLAALDAGVGGKTAINLPEAKNILGTFQQPRGVYVPLAAVLDEVHLRGGRDGGAELLKIGLLEGLPLTRLKEHGEQLGNWRAGDTASRSNLDRLARMLADGLRLKLKVVSEDEKELIGKRAILNLGHTLGHMVEAASKFQISHGQAVGWGLVAAARASLTLGFAKQGLVDNVEWLAVAFEVWPPPDLQYTEESLSLTFYDKKRQGDDLTLVLLESPGNAVLHSMPAEKAKNLLAECGSPILGQ
jgi:shikimate kinase / 3-dehydroquinate synthase